MIRTCCVALTITVAVVAQARASGDLDLNAADLDRLGVTMARPRVVTEVEVAAGPAEVVIPPAGQAIVSSTVSGVLSRVAVAEGERVTTGQPLADIASAELLRLQREFVEAAAAAELSRVQLERDRGLYADGIIAERRLQETSAAQHVASTALDHTRQQLLLTGMSEDSLDRLLGTRELISVVALRAPFDATVIEQMSALGAHVGALDPVYRLADLGRLWLEVHVSQERAGRIEPGMRLVVDTGSGALDAEINQVGSIVHQSSQTVLVRASVENTGLALRPGQYLPARILSAAPQDRSVLAVPSEAVVYADGGAHVFVGSNGQVTAQPVEILAEDGVDTYVRAGLTRDVEVAIAGIAALKSVWLSGQAEGE